MILQNLTSPKIITKDQQPKVWGLSVYACVCPCTAHARNTLNDCTLKHSGVPQRGWRPPGPQEAGWLAGKGQNSKTGWKCVQGGNEVHLSPLPTLSPLLTYATRRRRVYSAEKTNHTWNLVMQAKIGMRHPTEMRENKWNPAFWGGATHERER